MRYLLPLLALLSLLLVATPAWAAISYEGTAENAAGDGNDVTVTLPGGVLEDDLVIFAGCISVNDSEDVVMAMTTSGYTKVADVFSNDGNSTNLGVFWKVMGGTPDTTAVLTGNGDLASGVVGILMVFRGVDTVTPMDVTTTTDSGINTYIPDPPSIDFSDANAWVVLAACSAHGQATTTYTFPTGFTTNPNDDTANDTSDATIGIGYNSSPSDPEDPGVLTPNTSDNVIYSWAAATLALREAGAGAAPVTYQGIDVPGGVSVE